MNRRAFLATSALSAAPLRAAAPVTAAVREWNNKPTLFVNDAPVFPAFYALTDALGGRWSFDELPSLAIEQFARAGRSAASLTTAPARPSSSAGT